jgi:protein-tyrosine phosphatase/arsenate reductase
MSTFHQNGVTCILPEADWMKKRLWFLAWTVSLAVMNSAAAAADASVKLNPKLRAYVDARIAEFERIPPERKELLEKLAAYVQSRASAGQPVKLTFICTHNSRRSHLSQLWSTVAAAHYGIGNVASFSGGTESTAFNPRAVAALERAGFEIEQGPEADNPRYRVVFASGVEPQVCFSKVYDSAPNPTQDFCAIMTCSQADESCPTVQGAVLRLAIAFDDPKSADGTPQESATYDERGAQIARELLYAFSRVKG